MLFILSFHYEINSKKKKEIKRWGDRRDLKRFVATCSRPWSKWKDLTGTENRQFYHWYSQPSMQITPSLFSGRPCSANWLLSFFIFLKKIYKHTIIIQSYHCRWTLGRWKRRGKLPGKVRDKNALYRRWERGREETLDAEKTYKTTLIGTA